MSLEQLSIQHLAYS